MGRILFAWELGLNRGHAARIAPLAAALAQAGHEVRIAARDPSAFENIAFPAALPCAAAPRAPHPAPAPRAAAGYAGILLAQGWHEPACLGSLVAAWQGVFRSCDCDLVILDHAPTAGVAARLLGLPTLSLGNGFELPPWPLPPFPGATPDAARQEEASALAALRGAAGQRLAGLPQSLGGLLATGPRVLLTFAELDHYGPRGTAPYFGPLFDPSPRPRADWLPGPGPRIFAVVQPELPGVDAILAGLAASGLNVLAYAPGLGAGDAGRVRRVDRLIDLAPLLGEADLLFSYGAEATTLRFLLAGIPALTLPFHQEAAMAAQRQEALGVTVSLRGNPGSRGLAAALRQAVAMPELRRAAQAFAARHADWSVEANIRALLARVTELL
ncbi:MAG: hypothetical protein KA603_16215 [Azonexus sp.]|nr:hypothetical protein [Betaproteobacteria bacterium]MBP6037669.1 hypothetical protein [Azonexus sp.]MBP6908175.1 hypothetical protein [Azonexus sp.]